MAKRKLRVAFVTPEVAPYAKSGELADVAASLPKALAARGAEVSLFMPMYRQPGVESLSKVPVLADLSVPLGRDKVRAAVHRAELGWADLYLIDCPRYFHREHIYGPSKGAYLDNDERFAFFGRAVLEYMSRARTAPDVIHCNNWPSALIPVLLKTRFAGRALFKATATVLTLHNVAYQGEFPADSMSLAGLTWNEFASCRVAFDGKFNFLKAGVLFADAVNTVSQEYRKEILAGEQGPGLAEILKSQDLALHAIRNGIDTEEWDPATDPFITADFRPPRPTGRRNAAATCSGNFAFPCRSERPSSGSRPTSPGTRDSTSSGRPPRPSGSSTSDWWSRGGVTMPTRTFFGRSAPAVRTGSRPASRSARPSAIRSSRAPTSCSRRRSTSRAA